MVCTTNKQSTHKTVHFKFNWNLSLSTCFPHYLLSFATVCFVSTTKNWLGFHRISRHSFPTNYVQVGQVNTHGIVGGILSEVFITNKPNFLTTTLLILHLLVYTPLPLCIIPPHHLLWTPLSGKYHRIQTTQKDGKVVIFNVKRRKLIHTHLFQVRLLSVIVVSMVREVQISHHL